MASVLRDVLDAQAPGVFFGEGAKGLSYANVYKTSNLLKLGRGRGLVSALVGKKWAERSFKLYEDFRMQYFDGDVLRGEFPINGAIVEAVEGEKAEGKDFAFTISTKESEKILLAAGSEEERQSWIKAIKDVSTGKFRLRLQLSLIAQLLQYPEGTQLNIEIDEPALQSLMAADGYEADRMIEIVEEYLKNLYQHIARYAAQDNPSFAELFKSKFDRQMIRIVPAPDSNTSNGYYRTKFVHGELHVQFLKAWTNIQYLGEDLVVSISEGESIPYNVYKSIRMRAPVMQSYLTSIETLLGITGITYDYCLKENFAAMLAANYGEDRFGEIFFDEHLRQLCQTMAYAVGHTPSFKAAFVERFEAKRIVLRPASDPDSLNSYYESSFTAQGELLIQYRRVWTNLNSLGQDLESLVN